MTASMSSPGHPTTGAKGTRMASPAAIFSSSRRRRSVSSCSSAAASFCFPASVNIFGGPNMLDQHWLFPGRAQAFAELLDHLVKFVVGEFGHRSGGDLKLLRDQRGDHLAIAG